MLELAVPDLYKSWIYSVCLQKYQVKTKGHDIKCMHTRESSTNNNVTPLRMSIQNKITIWSHLQRKEKREVKTISDRQIILQGDNR